MARFKTNKIKRWVIDWLKARLVRFLVDKLTSCEPGKHVFRYQDAEPKMRDNNFKMVFRCSLCGDRFDVDSPKEVELHGTLAEPWMYE